MQRVFKIKKENVDLCILSKQKMFYFTVGHVGAVQKEYGPFNSKYDCIVTGLKELDAKIKLLKAKKIEKQQKSFHYGNSFFRRKEKIFP